MQLQSTRTVRAAREVGEVELDLVPAVVEAHRHRAHKRADARRALLGVWWLVGLEGGEEEGERLRRLRAGARSTTQKKPVWCERAACPDQPGTTTIPLTHNTLTW